MPHADERMRAHRMTIDMARSLLANATTDAERREAEAYLATACRKAREIAAEERLHERDPCA